MYKFLLLILVLVLCLTACKTAKNAKVTTPSPADILLSETIDVHGGPLYDSAHYQFIFRGNTYTFKNSGKNYEYTVKKIKDGKETFDFMTNDDFKRTVDGVLVELTEKEKSGYASSLNSVIYFATLPHKLKDPSVNVTVKDEVSIRGNAYKVLEVNFDEEGGGEDHEDVYYYWINKETQLIDYLAYNYKVNKGGVRFRAAFNFRRVDGIVFQDYINYKAPVGTPLHMLPSLYEKDELTQLSMIKTEEVTKL